MKNLKNLGQILSKAEQKTINGGMRHECDPGGVNNSGSPVLQPKCQCWAMGHYWNSECNRCENPTEHYFDDGNCGQIIFP